MSNIDFRRDSIKEVAKSLPDLMQEANRGYKLTEQNEYDLRDENSTIKGFNTIYEINISDIGQICFTDFEVWEYLEAEEETPSRRINLYVDSSKPKTKLSSERADHAFYTITKDFEDLVRPDPAVIEDIEGERGKTYNWL